MVQLGFRKPLNATKQGQGLEPLYMKIGPNGGNTTPLMLVMNDGNDVLVKPDDGTGKDVGFVGYEDIPSRYQPATVTTKFNVGDHVTVYNGTGRRRAAILKMGQNIAARTPLKSAGDGTLTAGVIGTDKIVAIAIESVNATAGNTLVWIETEKE